MDFSEFLLSEYKTMHKAKSFGFAAALEPGAINQRILKQTQRRQDARNTLLLRHRKISESKLTPINTPVAKSKKQDNADIKANTPPTKRSEMLKKWKMEKELRKQAEKAKLKLKPIFKVCRVPTISLSIDRANQEIKGKKITSSVKKATNKYQFAPSNHQFRPPKNVNPILLKLASVKKAKPVMNFSPIVKRVTRSQAAHRIKLDFSSNVNKNKSRKQVISQSTSSENNENKVDIVDLKTTDTNHPRESKTVKRKTPVRNRINKVDIEDTNATDTSQYKKGETVVKSKTPRRNRKYKIDVEETNTTDTSNFTNSVAVVNPKIPVRDRKNKMDVGETNQFMKNEIDIKRKTPMRRNKNIIDVGDTNINDTSSPTKKKTGTKPKTPVQKVQSSIAVEESVHAVDFVEPVKNNSASKFRRKIIKTPYRKARPDPDETEETNSTKKTRLSKEKSPSLNNSKSSSSPEYQIIVLSDDSDGETNSHSNKPIEYISPFVTISRGKTSARKEYSMRHSKGGTLDESIDGKLDTPKNTSPAAGAAYFNRILDKEIINLNRQCELWTEYKNTNNPPEEACDLINLATGQTQLLVNDKFQQFRNLIHKCEAGNSDQLVTLEDLHGFWDMVYIQVKNVQKRFASLQSLRESNWQELLCTNQTKEWKPAKKPLKKKSVKCSAGLRAAIANARKNKAADVKITHDSRPGSSAILKSAGKSARNSLRVSFLTSQAINRLSSPGLTVMKVTQCVKRISDVQVLPLRTSRTPAKSILKTGHNQSQSLSKSVLFAENSPKRDNEENDLNFNNSISFDNTPAMETSKTPRRSARLRISKLF